MAGNVELCLSTEPAAFLCVPPSLACVTLSLPVISAFGGPGLALVCKMYSQHGLASYLVQMAAWFQPT